ncbi:DUF1810 domain-containing protein [Sphingomonas sp. GCM10030256]|uniref:DUF1810 domain-containing protein n=1 Tax=Sphingomonas sp. GCM10030256 TaxID=3273427 RepID=UPI003622C5E4
MEDDPHDLARFVAAQDGAYAAALAELRGGRKRGHWIWFVLPQLRGLGRSDMASFYGIAGPGEARAYLAHPVLGPRLRECVDALLAYAGQRSAEDMLGPVDAAKLRSCLTLFIESGGGEPFVGALEAFYAGQRDEQTIALLA